MDDIGPFVKKLRESHGLTDDAYALIVDPGRQEMHLVKGQMVEHTYVISTSRLGLGNTHHSYRTPWGTHRISLKIGAGAKRGAIFRHKKPTGGVANVTSGLHSRFHMTSRLLCLDGQEEGVNKGIHKGVTIDSFIRCIYIHGINAEGWIGRPCSGGCVVMTNDDVIELFDKVPEGTLVEILKREYKQT